jgi:plasmid stabilization system protein ParE
MMPSPSAADGEQTVSASTPREIRAALTGEEIAHFDREYRHAMADAAESLDLSGVVSMLRRWQRVAWSTQDDPDAHRHMLACVDELNTGGDVATESWRATKARLSL